jgi:hypothetical protein
LWNSCFLKHMASDHATGHKNYVREIDAVLTLDAVERLLFRDLPREAALNHQCPAGVTDVRNNRAKH